MTVAKPEKPALIDTISAGYAILNRKLWVLIIPVALNLYFWLGAKLSFAPFLSLLRDKLSLLVSSLVPDPLYQEQLVVSIQNADMRQPLARMNLVPVLPSWLLQDHAPFSGEPWYIRGAGAAAISLVVINLLALLFSSTFLLVLADGLNRQRCRPLVRVGQTLVAALRIGGYWLLLIGCLFVFAAPAFFLVLPMDNELGQSLTVLLVLLTFVTWFWLYLYTGFALEAIALNKVGLLKALRQSVQIVEYNFFSAVGLLLLSFLILHGMRLVWEALAQNLAGLLLAMAGSAYIGSGLVAARLVFYRDRLALLWKDIHIKKEML